MVPKQPDDGSDEQTAHTWQWPEMEPPQGEAESNALGYPPDWYRKPEPEVDEPEEEEPQQPLTLEEIEAVRQAAYDDGFAEGREAGEAKGLEEGKLLGLQQGHEAGFEQGKEEGLALGRELIESQATQWQALLDRLAQPLHELDEQVENQLVWLAMRLARALIKQEVHTSSDLLLGALKEAIGLLPAAEEGVRIALHPEDLALVQEVYGEEACAKRGWQLEADPTLGRGDLQMSSHTSSIDMLLEQRIDQLLRQFLRSNLERGA